MPVPEGGPTLGQSICGPVASMGYGPFDYRGLDPYVRWLVEHAHFTPVVEALIKGQSATIGADIDYTLRAIPNHHRALVAMTRLVEKTKSQQPPGARSRAECYFDRAARIAPDDARIYSIYGDYLRRSGREADARKALELSERLGQGDPYNAYNLALVWLDLKQPDRAVPLARMAYSAGTMPEGLRNRLKAEGRW